MFENKESTGRMGKWATELAEHVINFVARSAIKSQVLTDFVADWTPSAPKGEAIVSEPVWEVQCDGAYCHLGSAAATVLKSPSGIKLRYALRLNCDNCTNNMAEYEGLLLALRKARAVGGKEARHLDGLRTRSRPYRENLQGEEARHDEVPVGCTKHGKVFHWHYSAKFSQAL
jgi:hypothetical protein